VPHTRRPYLPWRGLTFVIVALVYLCFTVMSVARAIALVHGYSAPAATFYSLSAQIHANMHHEDLMRFQEPFLFSVAPSAVAEHQQLILPTHNQPAINLSAAAASESHDSAHASPHTDAPSAPAHRQPSPYAAPYGMPVKNAASMPVAPFPASNQPNKRSDADADTKPSFSFLGIASAVSHAQLSHISLDSAWIDPFMRYNSTVERRYTITSSIEAHNLTKMVVTHDVSPDALRDSITSCLQSISDDGYSLQACLAHALPNNTAASPMQLLNTVPLPYNIHGLPGRSPLNHQKHELALEYSGYYVVPVHAEYLADGSIGFGPLHGVAAAAGVEIDPGYLASLLQRYREYPHVVLSGDGSVIASSSFSSFSSSSSLPRIIVTPTHALITAALLSPASTHNVASTANPYAVLNQLDVIVPTVLRQHAFTSPTASSQEGYPKSTSSPLLSADALQSLVDRASVARICVGHDWFRFPSSFFLPDAHWVYKEQYRKSVQLLNTHHNTTLSNPPPSSSSNSLPPSLSAALSPHFKDSVVFGQSLLSSAGDRLLARPRTVVDFIDFDFDGILPQHFPEHKSPIPTPRQAATATSTASTSTSASAPASAYPSPHFNDLNQRDESRFVPHAACDYIVDSDIRLRNPGFLATLRALSVADEWPGNMPSLAPEHTFRQIMATPMIDAEMSPSLHRAFYIQPFWRARNRFMPVAVWRNVG
jgi:hypothetical protein